MKFLLICGSLRKDSLNKKLLEAIALELKSISGSITTLADLKSLEIPLYDGDVETQGIPAGVKKLGLMIQAADALICASPEYNGSIAGPFKNAIDWVSRIKPNPFNQKAVLLTGASPGAFGSMRALGQTRTPFEALGSFVLPQTFALPRAHEAFLENGELADSGVKKRLSELLATFQQFAEKF